MLTLLFAIVGVAGGCGSPPKYDALIWSRSLAYAEPLWRAELARHGHKNVLIVACHGTDRLSDGAWVLMPDKPLPQRTVQETVDFLLDINPHKKIFLMVCNPKGTRLSVRKPGSTVLYGTNIVWAVPGTGLSGQVDRACELVEAVGK